MTSDTSDIFSRFYSRVEDYKIAGLSQSVVEEMLNGYLKAVIAQPFVRRLFARGAIEFDEDVGELTYTMRESWDDSSDQDFVEEMIALGMVCQWISPRYHSTLLTSQMFTNKEMSYFSQANQMIELKNMYEKAQNDFRKYIRDRGYGVSLMNSE